MLVRFDFKDARKGRPARGWLLVEDKDAEICSKHPGFEEDLIVAIEDSKAFGAWHLGLVDWGEALQSGKIRVDGRRDLARALPTWNAGPQLHAQARGKPTRVPDRRNAQRF